MSETDIIVFNNKYKNLNELLNDFSFEDIEDYLKKKCDTCNNPKTKCKKCRIFYLKQDYEETAILYYE